MHPYIHVQIIFRFIRPKFFNYLNVAKPVSLCIPFLLLPISFSSPFFRCYTWLHPFSAITIGQANRILNISSVLLVTNKHFINNIVLILLSFVLIVYLFIYY